MLVSRAFLFLFLVASTSFVVAASIQQMGYQDKIAQIKLPGQRVIAVEIIREHPRRLASLPNKR